MKQIPLVQGLQRVQRRGLAQDMAICGLFAALIAIGAFIKIVIPVGADTMNLTLQWFFVLLAGLLLGSRRAAFSVAVYLVIGLLGIPIFARGGGPAYLLRPTFGFLLGFLPAAFVAGKLCQAVWFEKIRMDFLAVAAGYGCYYGMGILYFYFITHTVIKNPIGWKMIVTVYCLPTMVPDILLCMLAVTVSARLRPAIVTMLK